MSRRFTQSSSSGLDSDSFLDVVANLVGILIILVVVAGLKVSQTPPTAGRTAGWAEFAQPSLPPVPPDEGDAGTALIIDAPAFKTEAAPLPALPANYTVEPPAELVRRVEALIASLAQTETSLGVAGSRLAELERTQASLAERVSDSEAEFRSFNERLATERERLDRMQAYLRERENRLGQVRAEATSTSATAASEPKRLEHSLTPIAKVVEQREIMLYLAGNRVSVMPWEELFALAGDELWRTTSFKQLEQDGFGSPTLSVKPARSQAVSHFTLGPIAGFHLACERGRVETNKGNNVSFEFVPADDLVGETAEEALTPGSEFLHAVETAGRDATLTFWVYPDSFETYHKLREACQQGGLHVAGRPMPFGVHVGQSPEGSRSVSQ